ncbi:ric8a [Carabus blaptoides fortunei]
MNETEIKNIILGEDGSLCQNINKFIEKHADTFSFPMLNSNDLRKELWSALFRYLQNKQLRAIHIQCLSAIRILSRDKTGLNEIICDNWMNILLYHSDLKEQPEEKSVSPNYTVIIEGLKCLCNLVFNSSVASTISSQNGTLEAIMKRVLTYRDPEVPTDVKYFDMRLLFIITALCAEIRPKLQNELHGGTYLIEILDLILKEAAVDQSNSAGIPSNKVTLSDSQVDLACEILKVLFNLYVNSNFTLTNDEEEETHYLKLIIVLHDMLLASKTSPNSRADVHVQIISLLTALPSRYLKELYTPVTGDPELSKEMEYEGYNMEAVHLLLASLQNRLNNQQKANGKNELLTPILTLLVMCASSSRIMRKYLRNQILPPLKDVHNRPEQGSTLRNHLCRLLTSPDLRVRDLAAELIFVLCKENVGRMIKYTGYGNAAGWFANRGLLLGGRLEGSLKYSSESEDSDTEEYKEYKHGINHVMGCYEPPHPQTMTEEQKEHEALILAELMQNLIDKKLIKPCIVNEDGRPEPVDNVLQLQNALPRLQIRRNSESS